MLEKQDLSNNIRNALKYTIEEKELIQELMETAQMFMNLLLMRKQDAIRSIEVMDPNQNGIEYLRKELLPMFEKEDI